MMVKYGEKLIHLNKFWIIRSLGSNDYTIDESCFNDWPCMRAKSRIFAIHFKFARSVYAICKDSDQIAQVNRLI